MGSFGWAFMWSAYAIIAVEWLLFWFGWVSVKFYLAYFEFSRFWSLSIIQIASVYLFGVSVFVEYMSNYEIMFTAINMFLIAPA